MLASLHKPIQAKDFSLQVLSTLDENNNNAAQLASQTTIGNLILFLSLFSLLIISIDPMRSRS